MSTKESASLLMLCGALQDISEVLNDENNYIEMFKKDRFKNAAKQIIEVQLKIEVIAVKSIKYG